jgi:Uncharacterized protein conserved in bacteria (DUF2325)
VHTFTVPAMSVEPHTKGSRRRRIWELGTHVHCPVLGVCLPIQVLRRLLDKVLGGHIQASDYEIHCGAIAQCSQRSPMAEAIQRELDRRCAGLVRQANQLKTTEALATWWQSAAHGHDLSGALWATLTHSRCTRELEQHILAEVHMLQHQIGSALRADRHQLQALTEENAVLTRELAAIQQRVSRQVAQQAHRIETQQADMVRLRAELIGRDSLIAALHQDLAAMEAATPALKQRVELTEQVRAQMERIHELQRALLLAEQARDQSREQAVAAKAELTQVLLKAGQEVTNDSNTADPVAKPELRHPSVLCVGGRRASIPIYRQVIEGTGSRFLHHDGGEKDQPSQLDITLAAADLVICQTGCISHDAYWRVKEHCKRTGKRCVFLDTPSRSSLERAMEKLTQTLTVKDGL